MSGTAPLPTAYAVWCVLRRDAATAWTAQGMAAQVDGSTSTVRYILPALVEAGYVARERRGGGRVPAAAGRTGSPGIRLRGCRGW